MTDVDAAIERAERKFWRRSSPVEDTAILAAEVKRLREALDRCRKGINTWDDK